MYAHPEITDVAVYGRADEKWGAVPVPAVVTTNDTLSAEEIGAWLDVRLARFKHPKDIVVYDELPRNAGGKVVKGVLRDRDPASV